MLACFTVQPRNSLRNPSKQLLDLPASMRAPSSCTSRQGACRPSATPRQTAKHPVHARVKG